MRLIAKKPCSFGGMQFFIGDEIPESIVKDVHTQEKLGVISVIEEAETIVTGELFETGVFDGKVVVPIIQDIDGDTAQALAIPLSEGEVQQVFAIMQMTAAEAEKEIGKVEEDNVLIVLHASDSRSGVKKAAKKRAEQLSSTKATKDEARTVNEPISGSSEEDISLEDK